MDNKIFKRLIKEALTPDFLKEEEIKHEGQSCDEAHPGLTHEEWEFEQSKKDSPEFWKDIWKVQKESVNRNEKNTIVVYDGKGGGGRILTFPPPPTLFDEPVNEDARGAYADIPTLNKHPDILNLIKNVEELVGIEVEADLRGYGGKGKGFYLTTPSLKFWEDDDKNSLKDAFNKTNNESGELTFEFQITDNYEMDPGERSWDAGFSFTVDEKGDFDDVLEPFKDIADDFKDDFKDFWD